jgi:hypothetical protein
MKGCYQLRRWDGYHSTLSPMPILWVLARVARVARGVLHCTQ